MANTATPAKTLSTARVTPQDRGLNSDVEDQHVFSMGVGSMSRSWKPSSMIRVTRVSVSNGDVLMDTATNTTAVDVDSEDNAGTKVADIAAKAAATSIAVDVSADLTLSTTEADLVVNSDEVIVCRGTAAGTQGEYDVIVSYKKLDVRDVPGDWPAALA